MLDKCVSGGQTGSDEGGLRAAKRFGIPTGGVAPRNFWTETGPNLELKTLYGLTEHRSKSYHPRTLLNVKDSDGTIRLAINFDSAGEILTLKAIRQYNKPHIDVDVADPIKHDEVVDWLIENNIKILNVAGNAESKYDGIGDFVDEYLFKVFTLLKERELPKEG